MDRKELFKILDQLRNHSWHGECCHDCCDLINDLFELFEREIMKTNRLWQDECTKIREICGELEKRYNEEKQESLNLSKTVSRLMKGKRTVHTTRTGRGICRR